MIRAIADLRQRLADQQAKRLDAFQPGSHDAVEQLRQVNQRLEGRARSSRLDSKGFARRATEAMYAFLESQDMIEYRHLKLVCASCSIPLDLSGETGTANDEYVLLTDAVAFDRLLGSIAGFSHEPRRFRRLYRELLSGYLTTSRAERWYGTRAAVGDEKRRHFLEEQKDRVGAKEPRPAWAAALLEHPDLLGQTAGAHFANSLLGGDDGELERVLENLGLTGASWLVGDALREAMKHASSEPDEVFQGHVPVLLHLIETERFASLRDEILAGILERWSRQASVPADAKLRDSAIEAWKNPWLQKNDSAWGRVSSSAREMVTGWLKLDLIHKFFEVMSDDGTHDTRRFDFWKSYHEEMEDVWFAIGSSLQRSDDPTIVKLRQALDGRLVGLTGVLAKQNAFVMQFRDQVAVEFSMKGNAAYVMGRNEFEPGELAAEVAAQQLRKGKQLRHDIPWEQKFHKALRASSVASGDGELIRAYAKRNKINVTDHREKGGSLLLEIDDADPEIKRQLAGWGFKFRAGRGWWRNAR